LARGDLYRWKDAEGVTHYAEELDRVPAQHRGSVERVISRTAKSRGPLPLLGGERAPGPDDAGFIEPGLGERAPAAPRALPDAPATGTAGSTGVPSAEPPTPPAPLPAEPAASRLQIPPPDTDPRELEVAELERELDARREELKALISQDSFDSSQISSDPRLRELAEIVPRLQAELDALRGELGRP